MGGVILIVIVFAALVLGGAVFLGGKSTPPAPHKPSRPGKPRAARPAKPAPGPDAPQRPAPPPSPQTRPYPNPLDFSHLEPVPEGVTVPGDEEIAADLVERVVGEARSVSDRLCSRRKIFDGISSAAVEPSELTELVLSDPALAGQVLRTVNSSFYGLRQPVASVFRAVLLLGHGEVRNIVWRASVIESLGSSRGSAGPLTEELWRHSFSTSRVAYAIAKSLGLAGPDEISTAALLHDIGKLICLHVWPDLAGDLYEPVRFGDLDLLVREQEDLKIDHARLGGEIARAWGLPEETCATITHHHAPSYVETGGVDGNPRCISAVHVADIICHCMNRQRGLEDGGTIYLPASSWVRALTGRDDLESVCSESVIRSLRRPGISDGGAPSSAKRTDGIPAPAAPD